MKKVKRSITLILLMLANIFLLAHSVLPHSHHDGTVCFSIEKLKYQNHCSDRHADLGDCCSRHHGTHHHSTLEECDLKEIVLRQNNDLHHDMLPCANCLALLFTIYPPNEFYLEAPEFGRRLRQKPCLENYIPPFAGSVKSLRAPPLPCFLG
ncbi:MAG: hypothetical protein LBR26_15305 [Prevotella sp.]|nr:hypothetical protein [Prevotella sp.]